MLARVRGITGSEGKKSLNETCFGVAPGAVEGAESVADMMAVTLKSDGNDFMLLRMSDPGPNDTHPLMRLMLRLLGHNESLKEPTEMKKALYRLARLCYVVYPSPKRD